MVKNGEQRERREFNNNEDSELNIDSSTEHVDVQPTEQPSHGPLQQEKHIMTPYRKRYAANIVSRSEAFEVLNIDSSRLAL